MNGPLRSRMTPFRIAIALVSSALVGAIAVVALRASDETSSIDVVRPVLALAGPDEIDAGDPWPIDVGATVTDDDAHVEVALVGAIGVRPVVDLDHTDGVVVVPGDYTTASGLLTAIVTVGGATGELTVQVQPGPAVPGIVPLAGPRSMVADGADWTMVTSFPRDRHGNAVADGTPVTVHVRRPDGSLEKVDSEVEHLLAAPRVFSTTTAGRTAVRVDVDGATGPDVEVSEVPGPPVEVELAAPATPLRADGRTLVPIVTGDLVDRYGNVLLDGTAVEVQVVDRAGARVLSTIVIDGRAELALEAPPLPGPLELVVEVDGTRSEVLTLDFELDVVELPVSVTAGDDDEADAVVVAIGPVTSALGGFVADGTPAEIVTERATVRTELRDGVASVAVEVASGETIVVRVLGAESEVEAP